MVLLVLGLVDVYVRYVWGMQEKVRGFSCSWHFCFLLGILIWDRDIPTLDLFLSLANIIKLLEHA